MTNTPQTVLILGAHGRMGRAAAHAFHHAGWDVRCQTRKSSPLQSDMPGKHYPVDIDDLVGLAAAANGCDVIVNALNPASYDLWEKQFPAITKAALHAANTSGATVIVPANVYVYGTSMPPKLYASTPHAATTKKGRLRIDMEAQYREADCRAIILHMGDFLEARSTGGWFDTHLTGKLAKGKFLYPGATDVTHAWTYLPDAGRSMVALAEAPGELPKYCDVTIPGTNLTAGQLRAGLEKAMGIPVKLKSFPWWMLYLIAPFSAGMRELFEMRYLWDTPHALIGDEFSKIAPDFSLTPVDAILHDVTRHHRKNTAIPTPNVTQLSAAK
ncbi:epimerase [Ahrensia sp. AH-315-G08]|nr:epimerase [Ahrensia sp. AH-315-G08]